jgi:antirestriction protein
METTRELPRIYVASLSDYNAGRLVGRWIALDETTDADDIHTAVQAMLKTSPEPIAEEWAIHDYEGFGDIHLDEYESFDRVAALVAALAEHGDAFAAWATDDWRRANPEKFTDQYLGEYKDRETYAQEDDTLCDLLDQLPHNLGSYFDWEAYARDLFMDLDDAPAPDGGIYVFDPNA